MGIFEREQVLYQLSMSIGNTLEIKPMCKDFLSTLLKKLTITTAAIIRKNTNISMDDVIFSIPKRIKNNQDYIESFANINSSDFKKITEISSTTRYILKLDDFGYLVMFTPKKFSELIVKSLELLLKKLTTSLIACDNYANLKESLIIAEEAKKIKTDFMANMSHELRTPLNAIIGFSNILNKMQTASKHLELSEHISSNATILLELINNILDLAKIENSNFSIDSYEFNAYKESMNFTHQFVALTYKKELIFNNHINLNLDAIFFADWTRIKQMILNLISNAVKFTPKNGEITFNADYKNEHLVFTVKDNGIGMSPEVQNKIFKPFQQADGTTTRKYGGTGLGLSITQSLIELMNGYIELESKKDIGTTISIHIPIKKIAIIQDIIATEKLENSHNKYHDLNKHILIVEDNKTNQILLEMLLGEYSVTCDIANDGIEAVEMYNPNKHSLILMDENMPNMNGLEAMKKIRQKHKNKCGAIIALTANAMDGDRERFLKLGMDDYISKPIDNDKLYQIIKGYLNRNINYDI